VVEKNRSNGGNEAANMMHLKCIKISTIPEKLKKENMSKLINNLLDK
jgi:hypothetical protein